MENSDIGYVAIQNISHARFRCNFPNCGGICCQNGRPGLDPEEIDRISANIEKFIPFLRPAAIRHLRSGSYLSNRRKEGRKTIAVVNGWCVFANQGCILQKLGEQEGEKWKYKPHLCVLFPISHDKGSAGWYIRQKGYRGERWELQCIENAAIEKDFAKEFLIEEIKYLELFSKKRI